MCVHIASIHSEKLASYHPFIKSRTQSEKKKKTKPNKNNSLQSNIIGKEFFFCFLFFQEHKSGEPGGMSQGRGWCGYSNDFRLCVKSQAEAQGSVIRGLVSLSGWKFGAGVHGHAERRQEVCWGTALASSCSSVPPLEVEGCGQRWLAKP